MGENARTTQVQPHDAGSPDPIIAIAWIATLPAFNYAPPVPLCDTARARTDAALTYLHTRRLRL
jgi:hypothetical protein